MFGTWLGCRYAVPEMIKRGGGSIVNASSMCALMGAPGKDAYTAARGAISALTRSMAVELAPHNIWLVSGNCGCFGGIPRASFITQPAGWWICGQHKRVAHNPTAATSAEAEISSATTAGIFTPHRG